MIRKENLHGFEFDEGTTIIEQGGRKIIELAHY